MKYFEYGERDEIYRLRRVPDISFSVLTSNTVRVRDLQAALMNGTKTHVCVSGWSGMVFVTEMKPTGSYDHPEIRVTVKPTGRPDNAYTSVEAAREYYCSLEGKHERLRELSEGEKYWLGLPTLRSEMTFPINFLEDSMKVYEAIVVLLNDKKEPCAIMKVVQPFLAETDQAAREAVLVDFAAENKISGKDLAGYQVRVRTFSVA